MKRRWRKIRNNRRPIERVAERKIKARTKKKKIRITSRQRK